MTEQQGVRVEFDLRASHTIEYGHGTPAGNSGSAWGALCVCLHRMLSAQLRRFDAGSCIARGTATLGMRAFSAVPGPCPEFH